jgi:hypothetical protein
MKTAPGQRRILGESQIYNRTIEEHVITTQLIETVYLTLVPSARRKGSSNPEITPEPWFKIYRLGGGKFSWGRRRATFDC